MTALLVRRWWAIWLLWAGIVLCGAILIRDFDRASSAFAAIEPSSAVGLAALLLLVWLCATAGWRSMLLAFTGQAVTYPIAARHLALLLLGKYVPGGVWGFLARFVDSVGAGPRNGALQAGMVEQLVGLLALSGVSAVFLISADSTTVPWLLLLPALPFAVFAAAHMFHSFVPLVVTAAATLHSRIGRNHSQIRLHNGPLAVASVLVCLQQAMLLSAVALVASSAFDMAWSDSIAVAGAYGLSIVVGVLAVVAPGGMLVREAAFAAVSGSWLPLSESLVLAAMLRLLFTAFDLLVGAAAAGAGFWRRA